MPNKRKRRGNAYRKMKFQQHKWREVANAERRMKKWKRVREYWASNTEYVEQQAEKGYERVGGKWVKMGVRS